MSVHREASGQRLAFVLAPSLAQAFLNVRLLGFVQGPIPIGHVVVGLVERAGEEETKIDKGHRAQGREDGVVINKECDVDGGWLHFRAVPWREKSDFLEVEAALLAEAQNVGDSLGDGEEDWLALLAVAIVVHIGPTVSRGVELNDQVSHVSEVRRVNVEEQSLRPAPGSQLEMDGLVKLRRGLFMPLLANPQHTQAFGSANIVATLSL